MTVKVEGDRVRVWIDGKMEMKDKLWDELPDSGSLVLKPAPEGVQFRKMQIQESSSAVSGKRDSNKR
jgi:hypothetical protein